MKLKAFFLYIIPPIIKCNPLFSFPYVIVAAYVVEANALIVCADVITLVVAVDAVTLVVVDVVAVTDGVGSDVFAVVVDVVEADVVVVFKNDVVVVTHSGVFALVVDVVEADVVVVVVVDAVEEFEHLLHSVLFRPLKKYFSK